MQSAAVVLEAKMRAMVRMATAAAMMLGLVAPAVASPAGVWEFETRDTRVKVEMCGDGTALCGTLVWLKDTSYNEKYERYLNTVMVDTAEPSGRNRWRGDMNFFGQKAAGTITQVGEDQISIQGCVMLVLCKTYQLYRYED
jgi:uncharacterized protein (DUF2147 family)